MSDYYIEEGFVTIVTDGTVPFGAVRSVRPHGRDELVIYIENAGDFTIPYTAIKDVHSKKVILDEKLLTVDIQNAILHSHIDEQPN